MNNFRYIILSLLIMFLVTSCSEKKQNDDNKIEMALLLSGKNRPELEKVLRYYSVDSKDSLKLKAAEFLISNMTHHRSICGEYIENYIKTVDTLYKEICLPARSVYYMIPTRIDSLKSSVKTEFDIENITADFLIRNIEYSFNTWENSIYEPRLSFDDFCEYILPYKHSEEPLILWKDSLNIMKEISRDLNIYELNISMANTYHTYFIKTSFITVYNRLFANYDNDKYQAYMDMAFLCSKGVPTAIDFIPFADFIRDNFWTTNIEKKRLDNKFNYKNRDFSSKVFRKTYSLNPTPNDKINFVPDFIRDPYNKDVTEIYQNVTTVEYDFGDVPSNVKYAYLAVFCNGEWCEVAWSELKNGKAKFENMGRDIIYMPIYYDGNDKICAKNANLLNRNGEISEIGISDSKKETVKLERVSAYDISGEYQSRSIIGSAIAACDILDRTKFDTLATITHSKYNSIDTLNVNSDKKYKYWLFISKNYLILSELQFFDKNGEQIQGQIIWFDNDNKISYESSAYTKLFDNDISTSATIYRNIGLLLDKPAAISYVKYIPQSDKCGIVPGNEYELFYFNNGEWLSLEKKIATDYKIEFHNVPMKALLWVHDHGKECNERPFTVNNGKIKFW